MMLLMNDIQFQYITTKNTKAWNFEVDIIFEFQSIYPF